MTFEPHPRDYFAARRRQARTGAGAHRHAARQAGRTGALRHRPDRGAALRRALRRAVAAGLHRRRAGAAAWARATCWSATTSASAPSAPATTRCSTPPARRQGFDVARMNSYEVHGLRVSSSAVREALAAGDMDARGRAAGPALQHQRPCGARRASSAGLGERAGAARFRTLNLRFSHCEAGRACGIFAVRVHGLADDAAARRGQPGHAPARSDDAAARVLLETYCLRMAAGPRAPRGATVKSSAWNCCTNCATKPKLRRAGRPDGGDPQGLRRRACLSCRACRQHARPAARPRATEFSAALACSPPRAQPGAATPARSARHLPDRAERADAAPIRHADRPRPTTAPR